MFYSEFAFYGQWAEPGLPVPGLPDLALMYLFYVAMAYVLLSMISYFRARSLSSLFIAGAAYGWLLEGVVVTTVYENLPFSLSWTGLAWHAPLDFLFGIYLVLKVIKKSQTWKAVSLFCVMGILWGIWISWSWYERGEPIPLEHFLSFSFMTVSLLIAAYWVLGRLPLEEFKPSRPVVFSLGILLLASYLLNTLFTYPVSGFLLLPLLLICWWALRINRSKEKNGQTLKVLTGRSKGSNLTLLYTFPLTASLTYAFLFYAGLKLPSHIFLGLPASLVGAVLFPLSVWKITRSP